MPGINVLLVDTDNSLINFIAIENVSLYQSNNFNETMKKINFENFEILMINPVVFSSNEISDLINISLIRKIPTIIIMEKNEDIEKVLDALSAGAFDYFQKPYLQLITNPEKELKLKEIETKIKSAIDSKDKIEILIDLRKDKKTVENCDKCNKIIIIGSSTGGPQTLEKIIPDLPKNMLVPIIVVQHMPTEFTERFAKRLDDISNLRIKEIDNNEEIRKGICYIAKGDYHLELRLRNNKTYAQLNKKERLLGVRPNINITMQSAAKIYGENTIGVILTGMGCDGTIGAKKIKEAGGKVLVQSEKTSIINGMPKSVILKGYYDKIIDINNMTKEIIKAVEC